MSCICTAMLQLVSTPVVFQQVAEPLTFESLVSVHIEVMLFEVSRQGWLS